ncbi:ABC transporter ATP-binding protein [Xanthobacter sp. KR7-65]|uniref:ABC transporter ATP-binding protein n=1 Tax=Xanthobacter sp. KR7-65 TaxID=3156612 RepID=UPI0032B452E0
MTTLRLEAIEVRYGQITALTGVSLEVKAGEIVTLIGANGAGKTTTLNSISGFLRPASGAIWLGDQRIDGMDPERIVDLGIVQVPEGRRVFAGLTVEDNLKVGATRWYRWRSSLSADLARVYEMFPRLRERRKQLAWSLSGGEQQMLALGRALMGRPSVLLLDEPSLGLAPNITQELMRTIVSLNRAGITILLVEQDAHAALKIASRGYALELGSVALSGACKDLREDPRIRQIYLGA